MLKTNALLRLTYDEITCIKSFKDVFLLIINLITSLLSS